MKKLGIYLYPVLAFTLPFALYVKTLSPTYVPIDSAEFTMCIAYWGLCHPPGFPLYILLGKIFTDLFPFGPLIWKANLYSGLFGALTILVVYFGLLTLKVKSQLAFLLSLFFAVSFIFWEYSVAADVFTFATFLISLAFVAFFKKRLYLAAFILGLSASHFYITAVLLPIFYLYYTGLKFKFKEGFLLGVFFAAGLFPQVIMYMRAQQNPEINWGHARGLLGYYHFLRRTEFGSIFLIANPSLTFSPVKFFNHLTAYFPALATNFGVILPFTVVAAAAFAKLFDGKKAVFLLACFGVLLFVQLFLLSTIDPKGDDNPFQIGKFYLTSFTVAVFLMGIALGKLNEKFYQNNISPASMLLILLIIVYFLSNSVQLDMSRNYFSQNMVLDSLDQLEEDSIAITVSHIFYFGALYEQKINHRYSRVVMLYFPNEKNRDGEYYHPEVFAGEENQQFIQAVKTGKNLGKAEEYVLATISRNLDKPIYIFQGSFEENFFAYLKPYIRPYGMWWKVEPNRNATGDLSQTRALFDKLRNRDVKYEDLQQRAQKLDTLNYAVAYHSTAVLLGSVGKYDEALEFMRRSYNVRPKGDSIQNEIELLEKTKVLDGQLDDLVKIKGTDKLAELGNNLFTLANYKRCAEVFGRTITLGVLTDAGAFNNLASCQASMGKVAQARDNYEKALVIDPNLDLAKKGLDALGE